MAPLFHTVGMMLRQAARGEIDGVGELAAGAKIPLVSTTSEVVMASAATMPSSGARARHAESRSYGLVLFASILLVVIGCFNLIYGIVAIANSYVFAANAHYVVGNLRAWSWITLIVGVLQLLAAAGVMAGNQLARWAAVALLGLNAFDQMFLIPAYPFWPLAIIAIDVVALWGLYAYGSPGKPGRRLTYSATRERRRS